MLHGLRTQARVTQAEIARAIGIDPSLISRIERGSRPASRRIVQYYSERFGSSEMLLGLVDLARHAEADRQARRDPQLIAKQALYPLAGDRSAYVSEEPPDGTRVATGSTFKKRWTIRNSGSVPWVDRRIRRIGPAVGPWTVSSEVFATVPDTHPGDEVTLEVQLRAPSVETSAIAQWKMVDDEGLLVFPDRYSVGLALHVIVQNSWRAVP